MWAMMPLTLAASLPQMHCRLAETQGQRFCECCFQRYRNETSSSSDSIHKCCQHKRLKQDNDLTESPVTVEPTSNSPTCGQMSDPKSGNCCSWTSAVLSAPGAGVTPSAPTDTVNWEMTICDDTPSILARFARHHRANPILPQLDRITVFQHLVI